MKQSTELNNLLSLIFQDARTMVKDGQLLIPPEIAKRFGDQIRKFKPEILLALGHCPECGHKLTIKVESLPWIESRMEESVTTRKTGIHTYCFFPRHFDKWDF